MILLRQELQLDLSNSIKAAFADTVSMVLNKMPAQVAIQFESVHNQVRGGFDTKQELTRMSRQLSK